MARTLTLEEVKNYTPFELLQKVIQGHEPVTIILDEGKAVTLEEDFSVQLPVSQPSLKLKPLMTLPGFVPDGWQDVIYDDYH